MSFIRFRCIPHLLSLSRSRDGADRRTRFTTGVVGVGPAIAWPDLKYESRADPILRGSPQGIPFLRPDRPHGVGWGGGESRQLECEGPTPQILAAWGRLDALYEDWWFVIHNYSRLGNVSFANGG